MAWKTITLSPAAPSPREQLLRRAIAAAPDDARLHIALARLLRNGAHYADAADAFDAAMALQGDRFADWPAMAAVTLLGRGAAAALLLCDTRWHAAGDPRWHHLRGRALRRRKRIDEARAEFARAIALGDPEQRSLRAMLGMYARLGDGAALLQACADAPPAAQRNAVVMAYRALALSLLGRAAQANALVDLDATTLRFVFTPPASFGDLAAFNTALANAILADRPPAIAASSQAAVNYSMTLPGNAALAALQAFIRDSVETYLGQLHGHPAIPPIPATLGDLPLECGAVVLRQQGRHGQHIHKRAWLSCVYHVQVPPPAAPLPGQRHAAGALLLGICDEIAPGHCASWGERSLPAIPGTLTIFPAHIFHDVAPTGADHPRIAIVSDLVPAGQSPAG